jgi:hypothetical protein
MRSTSTALVKAIIENSLSVRNPILQVVSNSAVAFSTAAGPSCSDDDCRLGYLVGADRLASGKIESDRPTRLIVSHCI